MDAVEYIKTLRSLCKSKRKCTECPLLNKEQSCCIADIGEYAEKSVQIVEQWEKDNSAKTRKSEMQKIFPDVRIVSGAIYLCPRYFLPEEARDKYCKKHETCEECRKDYWLTEVTDND